MNQSIYHKLCITNITNGVAQGLSQFSQQSSAALIYVDRPGEAFQVFDPHNILKGHELKIKEIYFDGADALLQKVNGILKRQPEGYIAFCHELELAGLITFGGCSHSFYYQMWLTEHHPDMCSIEPTRRWLEQAASLLATDYNTQNSEINSSDYVLKNYALQAIADYIVDERDQNLDFDSRILITPILNDILNISKTREEGAWARGTIFFTDPYRIPSIRFITKIKKNERPMLSNVKHVRKLLQTVEYSDRKLVSDGCTIIGITDCPLPEYTVVAEYKGEYGFLRLGKEKICSFFDGSFHSTTREAKLVELEEILLDADIETETSTLLFQLVARLVHHAGKQRHGCTLVIDLNEKPVKLSGHVLDPGIDLLDPECIDLACSLLKIDGAVHIRPDLTVHGFGCLLDGKTIPWENMARGARYNSALRFSAGMPDVIVVVVSSDRPVSIIYNGIEINSFSSWRPVFQSAPEPVSLKKFINGVL
ncbi:MAG: DNA-binding protein [Desulfobacteraceae bacterium]|nr:MAG: DNA-binding protein [Desulfobacteraceae bacterium]